MRTLRFCLIAMLVIIIPTVSGQYLRGTEELPELWGDDAVSYSAANQASGITNHDYLAINRSWMEVSEDDASFVISLRVVSTERLEENLDQYNPRCRLVAGFAIDGEPSGDSVEWSFWWYNNGVVGTDQRDNVTMIFRDGQSSRDPSGAIVDGTIVETTFEMVEGTPGYYRWTNPKADLKRYGTELVALEAECYEYLIAQGFSTPNRNGDFAESKSVFSLEENRRLVAPDGSPDDLETLNSQLPPVRTTSDEADQQSQRTPGLALVGALGGLVAALWFRRRSP